MQKDYYVLVFGSEEGEKLLSAAKKCAETETEQIWYPVDPTHVALLQYCTEENPMEPPVSYTHLRSSEKREVHLSLWRSSQW